MIRAFFIKSLVCFLAFLSGTVYAQSIRFDLFDNKGPVSHESYPGKYLLMAIGYTSCPDICPTTLYEFGAVMRAIKNPDAIQPLFVTIDPTNDEVNRLNAYTGFFDKRIVGLSGTKENIKHFADQLGATYGYSLHGKRIEDPAPGMSYAVYHSALIYLIGPDRELLDVYDYQIGVEGLVEALDEVLGSPEAEANPSSAMLSARQTSEAAVRAPAKVTPALNCELPEGFVDSKEAHELSTLLDSAPASRVSLLNLWATWCAPCRVELPILDTFAGSQNDMSVIALNLNEPTERVAEFFKAQAIKNLQPQRSEDNALLRRLGGIGLPFNALFVDGQAVAIKNGVIKETEGLSHYAQCFKAHAVSQ
ncbi:SCO family protein [Oligella urethralis]|uniref:SCO family protein n=1 Tax=Oligella urethralis TaxID=90245 RepID=UPI000379C6D3|nr:SCO family protein [Oligella urethralis]SUA68674.1 Cytochrome c biogenesis protein tlpA [Oligella urethralis]